MKAMFWSLSGCVFLGTMTPSAYGVLLLDQIGAADTFDTTLSITPNVSQTFTDFPAFSSLSLDDFEAEAGELTIRAVQAVFQAQNGFESFDAVEEYRVSFFSDPSFAESSLLGDVGEFVLDLARVSVSPLGNEGHGLVTLNGEWELPEAGTYWIGIAPVASFSVVGQFFLANGGVSGLDGGANGFFVNSGEGFGQGPSLVTGADFAIRISTEPIPEPGVGSLILLTLPLCLRRSRSPRRSLNPAETPMLKK